MNPPSYLEENKNYVKNLFDGTMGTVLVICYHCNSLFITERGPSTEFLPCYCPFCEATRSDKDLTLDPDSYKEEVKELAERIETSEEALQLAEKIKRVLFENEKQLYNVAACPTCNNRFVHLDEDMGDIMCCAFCGGPAQDMEALLELENVYDSIEQNPRGLENYINHLFFLKLADGIEDNFILTDVDAAFKRLRFVSPVDDRMAFWFSERDILSMLEFVKIEDIQNIEEK